MFDPVNLLIEPVGNVVNFLIKAAFDPVNLLVEPVGDFVNFLIKAALDPVNLLVEPTSNVVDFLIEPVFDFIDFLVKLMFNGEKVSLGGGLTVNQLRQSHDLFGGEADRLKFQDTAGPHARPHPDEFLPTPDRVARRRSKSKLAAMAFPLVNDLYPSQADLLGLLRGAQLDDKAIRRLLQASRNLVQVA